MVIRAPDGANNMASPQTDLTSDEEQSTTIDLSDAQVAEQVNSRSSI